VTRIDIENRTFEVPDSMNEMTVPQLVFLSELISEVVPVQAVKVKMLIFCIGGRVKPMKYPEYHRIQVGRDVFALTTDEIVQASAAFDYLFTKPDEDGNCFLDNRLTMPPVPFIRSGRIKLHAPGEALTECTYNQYIYLQTYDVMKDKNPVALYNFLGCMFRRDLNRFNPEDLNIRTMKKIKSAEVVLMMWYWIGSCRYIADKFPRIFQADDAPPADGNPYDGQQRLLDFMTRADAAKKQEYKRMKLYDVLFSLDFLLEQDEARREAVNQ